MIDLTAPLDQLPDPLPIEPLTKPFDVTITPPGSKSITCRAYVLAALAEGESRITRPLRADDTERLLAALCTLGAEARWEGEDLRIQGVAGRFPRGGAIDLGDGGAPTRFMIAAACLAAEPVVIDGSRRMRQRPIAEGVDFLRRLGAKIDYTQHDGRLPVAVVPTRRLRGGELDIPTTSSSQFISAMLLIGACLPQGLSLKYRGPITSAAYVSMTCRMLTDWGIRARHTAGASTGDLTHHVPRSPLTGRSYAVEPDASSAVYWWAAALLTPSARMSTPGITTSSLQPDTGFLSALWLPSSVQWRPDAVVVNGDPNALERSQDCSQMPDAAIALAVVGTMMPRPAEALSTLPKDAPQLSETFRLDGLSTLRVKESDRIEALATELRRLGCGVETSADSISVDPSTRHDAPVVVETYNDHRMAMAFAVLGLARPGVSIRNPACVAKSYPTFWRDFRLLYDGGKK